jgi:hypothetical protein
MNKAFCKEPDSTALPRCPRCGGDGAPVGEATVRGHVKPAAADTLGEPAYWCGTDSCGVAYFDLFERVVLVADACGLHWPKDPAGPLCACHGLTVDDVDADLAEDSPRRVREVIRKAGLPDAACGTASADGRSCVARVQRYFMRRRGGG